MKKNNVILFLLISIFATSIAMSAENQCSNWVKKASSYYNIDEKIIYSIAYIESKNNRYAILLTAKNKKQIIKILKKNNISYKKSGRRISIYPKTKKIASWVYYAILKNKNFKIIDYDLGVMQVNRKNFKRYKVNELKYYIDCKRNIFLGTDILRKCFNYFKNKKDTVKNTIECYNKGVSSENIKKSNYNYFNRFYRNYYSYNSVGER